MPATNCNGPSTYPRTYLPTSPITDAKFVTKKYDPNRLKSGLKSGQERWVGGISKVSQRLTTAHSAIGHRHDIIKPDLIKI